MEIEWKKWNGLRMGVKWIGNRGGMDWEQGWNGLKTERWNGLETERWNGLGQINNSVQCRHVVL